MSSREQTLTDRVRNAGVRGATSVDLVAIGYARSEEDAAQAEGMARDLLTRMGSIQNLGEAAFAEISPLTGLEQFEVLRIQALIEIGRRVGGAGKGTVDHIDQPEDAYKLLSYLKHEKREHFIAILLDAKNGIIRKAEIHIGTLSMSLVGAREVFREAIRDGASSIVVAHNHPSGDPTPSPEDVSVTKQLVQVGEMLDIPVLDHIIIGERKFCSLRRDGLM